MARSSSSFSINCWLRGTCAKAYTYLDLTKVVKICDTCWGCKTGLTTPVLINRRSAGKADSVLFIDLEARIPPKVNVTPRYYTEVVTRRVSPARVNVVVVEDVSSFIRI